jgi:transposase-like protein
VQQVAAALRVSPETIRRWCREAGHRTYAAYTAPQVRRLVERVRSGEAITRVALDEGVPYATAHTWCRRAGVRSAHRPVAARRRPRAAA